MWKQKKKPHKKETIGEICAINYAVNIRTYIILVLLIVLCVTDCYTYRKKVTELSSLESQLEREETVGQKEYECLENELNIIFEKREIVEENTKSSLKAIVSSEANYYNNNAQKALKLYEFHFTKFKKMLPSYKKRKEKIAKEVKAIQKVQKELHLNVKSSSTISENEDLERQYIKISRQYAKTMSVAKKSKIHADSLYEESYYLMLKIVCGEAGDNYSIDRMYVMRVIENRVKNKYFPDTIRGVIFQKGQYQPTWDGSFSKEPNQETKRDVKRYLKGKVKLDMPDNVVYQAMFQQGKVWKHVKSPIDSGHYYCYQ